MRSPFGTSLVAAMLLAALAGGAAAQDGAPGDSALWVVFDRDTPVATERSMYQRMGDSILVTAMVERQFVDERGERHRFRKSMVLAVDSRDLGLLRYHSEQDFQGRTLVRGLLPGDTSITFYTERDGSGRADREVLPPGRLFVMDAQLFTLFDVLCRSLAGKQFRTRRVQLMALQQDTLTTPLATVTALAADTLRLGSRRLVARRYTLEDPSATFELWADRQGRLVRLEHPESGLHVDRTPDDPPPPARRKRSTSR